MPAETWRDKDGKLVSETRQPTLYRLLYGTEVPDDMQSEARWEFASLLDSLALPTKIARTYKTDWEKARSELGVAKIDLQQANKQLAIAQAALATQQRVPVTKAQPAALAKEPSDDKLQQLVQRVVAEYYGIPVTRLVSTNKQRTAAVARLTAVHFCRVILKRSWTEIADGFGYSDHSAVLHGHRSWARKHENEEWVRKLGTKVSQALIERNT